MKKQKQFDCVQMKNAIQARRRQEYAGLTDEQIRERIARRLADSDDIVARKWRNISARDTNSATHR